MKAHAEAAGLDWEQIKTGLDRMLTYVEPIVRLTPNPYDDMAVTFLKMLIQRN